MNNPLCPACSSEDVVCGWMMCSCGYCGYDFAHPDWAHARDAHDDLKTALKESLTADIARLWPRLKSGISYLRNR